MANLTKESFAVFTQPWIVPSEANYSKFIFEIAAKNGIRSKQSKG